MSRYIDADKLKEKLHSGDKYLNMFPLEIANLQRELVREVEGYIDETPAEDVKPIIPGLESGNINYKIGDFRCTNCGFIKYDAVEFNFCPNCGAKMRKESEEKRNE